jgi:hypothetical protein
LNQNRIKLHETSGEKTDITKEDALKIIKILEEKKMQATLQTHLANAENQFSREDMQALLELERMQALDEVFFKTGVEEIHIEMAMDKYDLKNDQEYKDLIKSLYKAFQEKVTQIKEQKDKADNE